MRPKNIAVGELVVSPLNVREEIGDIQSLADSIRDDGLLHPLTVRPYGDQYEIVAGRRRYEACKLIGMKVIPCNVAEEMDDRRAVLTSLKENMRRGDLTAAEKKRGIQKLLGMNGGDTPSNRRKAASSLNISMAQLKEAIEVGEWAETLEPHNIAVRAPRRGETLGKTIVPTSAAKTLMKALKEPKVKDALGELPKEERKKLEAEVIREAVALKGPRRKEFLKQFEKDPLRPAAEIKRDVLAPGPSQPLLVTIPVRVENSVYAPLRQFALDNNLGDRVGLAAKNLITEGLATKGYIKQGGEGPSA
jgi:ParB/RepB/Spo0J family partition protein